MARIDSNVHQLTEFEFSTLTQAGSEVVEQMIMNRIRINQEGFDDASHRDIISYVEINARNVYHIRKEYRQTTIYFSDPIDRENLVNAINSMSSK